MYKNIAHMSDVQNSLIYDDDVHENDQTISNKKWIGIGLASHA